MMFMGCEYFRKVLFVLRFQQILLFELRHWRKMNSLRVQKIFFLHTFVDESVFYKGTKEEPKFLFTFIRDSLISLSYASRPRCCAL